MDLWHIEQAFILFDRGYKNVWWEYRLIYFILKGSIVSLWHCVYSSHFFYDLTYTSPFLIKLNIEYYVRELYFFGKEVKKNGNKHKQNGNKQSTF